LSRPRARRRAWDALFLDRDGTLIVERGFLGDPRHVRLARGAAARLKAFTDEGTLLFVVTNQSGLARGALTREEVDAVNAEVVRRLAARGVPVRSRGIGDKQQCACTLMLSEACAWCAFESITVTVNEWFPLPLADPPIMHVDEPSVRPEGRAPPVKVHVKGGSPPVNVMAPWYGLPDIAVGKTDWSITGRVAPEFGSTWKADSST